MADSKDRGIEWANGYEIIFMEMYIMLLGDLCNLGCGKTTLINHFIQI